MRQTFGHIAVELKAHAPFSAGGALVGLLVLVLMAAARVPHEVSEWLFDTFHPAHVFVSAIVTAAIFRLHSRRGIVAVVLVGTVGSVGIGTLSDCLIPFLGETLLRMPHAHSHIGFIELWWLVNPLAFAGVGVALIWPRTKMPHAVHVLLSTWASLFHMTMAHGEGFGWTLIGVPVFLFLAVWLPCCTSDIIFPLLVSGGRCDIHHCHHDGRAPDHDHEGTAPSS